jgi:multiple sugar transport system substrate-binding protein
LLGVTGIPGEPPASVPFQAQSWMVIYNRALFKKAGIKQPPRTWDEFERDAKLLTDPANGVYGVADTGTLSSAAASRGWALVSQYGGTLITPQGKSTMNTPATVDALTRWMQWVPMGIESGAVSTDATQTVADAQFKQGKAAMEITSIAGPAFTDPANYGIGPMPLLDTNAKGDRATMSLVAGENLVIMKSSKHVGAAKRLIKSLVSTPQQVLINKEYQQLPVTKAASADPTFSSPNLTVQKEILAKYSRPMPAGKNSTEVFNAFAAVIVDLARQAATSHELSRADVSKALAKADAIANAANGQ